MPIYLESIFTYRTFPHLFGSVGFTNYMHPRIGNCSSLLFVRVVYTYYLISLFSYYSVMKIINKVPVQILLLRNNLIRESCKKKKPESAASLSPVRCDRPNTIHIDGAHYKASTEIKLYLITFIFITFRPSPSIPSL